MGNSNKTIFKETIGSSSMLFDFDRAYI
ncbi:hypothetical protein DFO77_1712, partial [Marinilabilia salmonicolor]